MTISTYTDLQTAVADWLARADLAARIPDFVALAEGHFNRELRTREMVAVSSSALSFGAVTLPVDFLEWISAQWQGARTHDLRYCEPDSEQWRFRYRPNGDPSMFSVFGSNLQIRPAAAGTAVLTYYQQVPPLASNATNWLLTKSPDLYLYRALAEAYIYQKDDKRAEEFVQLAEIETKKAIGAADSNKLSFRPNAKPPGDDTGTA
jgi:hypothetical protein